MYTLAIERIVDAPVAIVWQVISDVERYAAYAPNLSHAEKTGDGNTPARRCYDIAGRSWNEACVLWEEGKQYSYVIDTSNYPYPFVQMKGTWGLDRTDAGVRVWMRFEYTPDKPGVLGWLIHRTVKMQFTPVVEELMDNWEAEIAQRAIVTA
ncbi:MAG: SRPBCC family protein [Chloroflexota bacterium]